MLKIIESNSSYANTALLKNSITFSDKYTTITLNE